MAEGSCTVIPKAGTNEARHSRPDPLISWSSVSPFPNMTDSTCENTDTQHHLEDVVELNGVIPDETWNPPVNLDMLLMMEDLASLEVHALHSVTGNSASALQGKQSKFHRFASSGMANHVEGSKFLQHQELKLDDNVCSVRAGGQTQCNHSHNLQLPSRVANLPCQSQIRPSAASALRTPSSWKDLSSLAVEDAPNDAQFSSRCLWLDNLSVRNGAVEEFESSSHRPQHNAPFLPAVLSFRSIEGLDTAICSTKKPTTGPLVDDGSYSWGNHNLSSSVIGSTELLHPISLRVSEPTLQVTSTSATAASSTSLPSTPTHVSDRYTVAEEYRKAKRVGEQPIRLSKGENIEESISEGVSEHGVGYFSKHVGFFDEGNSEGSGKSSDSQGDEIGAWSSLNTRLCSKPQKFLKLSGGLQFPNTSCFPIQETQFGFVASINPFAPETNSGATDPSLGAKEMLYRAAALQPINSAKEAIRRPNRRNVRISKDPQSVAARRRREKISDRIRILQSLVPGGTKMDTASMLDEAVQYVKFLKRQVQAMESLSLPRVTRPMFLNSRSSPVDMNNSVSSSGDCLSQLSNIGQMNSSAGRSAGSTGSGEAGFLCNLARDEV